MRWPVALPRLVLMTPLLFGCSQESNPSASPGPSGSVPAAGGQGRNTIQVGSRKIVVTGDVHSSTTMNDGTAVVSFGGRKLVIEFDKERIFLDNVEQATLPAGTKEVDIQIVDGKPSVTADGTAVLMPGASK